MKTKLCQICDRNRDSETIINKAIGNNLFDMCPDCEIDLKWTRRCLQIGTHELLKRYPTLYERASDISVRQVN